MCYKYECNFARDFIIHKACYVEGILSTADWYNPIMLQNTVAVTLHNGFRSQILQFMHY